MVAVTSLTEWNYFVLDRVTRTARFDMADTAFLLWTPIWPLAPSCHNLLISFDSHRLRRAWADAFCCPGFPPAKRSRRSRASCERRESGQGAVELPPRLITCRMIYIRLTRYTRSKRKLAQRGSWLPNQRWFQKRFTESWNAPEGSGRDLQGHITIELLVMGAIDVAHSTSADLFDDAVVAKRSANHGGGTASGAGHTRPHLRACQPAVPKCLTFFGAASQVGLARFEDVEACQITTCEDRPRWKQSGLATRHRWAIMRVIGPSRESRHR
jgi:hypothetical protein